MLPEHLKDLERGDHIKRVLPSLPVADHHGIYLGNNQVAHFYFPPSASGKKATKMEGSVRKDEFKRFADGLDVIIVQHWDLKKPKEEVAELAEKYAMQEIWKDQYNFFFKNCAHFVYYCYGEEDKVPILTKRLFHHSKPKRGEFVVGEVNVKTDGVGVHSKAVAIRDETEIGGVKLKAALGTAEAGAKVWEEDVGLDLGVKANARIGGVTMGGVTAEFGPSLDTGIKVGNDGIGLTVLGVGGQIGKKTNISLFGVKAEIDFGSWF